MAQPPIESEEAEFEQDVSAIDGALAQARAELGAMSDAASTADTLGDQTADYSLHEVHGMGRYAVVRRTGWRPLLKVIHDPAADIDFSARTYPNFDGVIAQNFQSPYLLDPLNDKYESYRNLRDNIAAVRNFMMEHYYVDTPAGMTPEKAAQAMNEIAKFVGKGLDNNYKFLGVLPNHHIGEPWIAISDASRGGGDGAQYLYEKILEMQRQSSWMRPFSAVIALFGGAAPPNWMLPPAHDTTFTDIFSHDIAQPHTVAKIDPKNAAEKVATLEAARQQRIDQHELSNSATDLNLLGEQLLYSAGTMQNVAQLSEPVRRDAIEIAKDILRKLRVSIGDINVKDGLNLAPKDDNSVLGSIKGVALIYERMLGWARGIDPTIMQHPSITAATQAIGQMGYLAKREALRMAKLAGNQKLEGEITEQLSKIPPAYSVPSDTKIAGLLDKVESGINVLMTRVQTISGPKAQIAHSASNELGSSINAAPTAGLGQQANAIGNRAGDDAAKRNSQLVAAQAATAQIQNNRAQAEAKKSTSTGVDTGSQRQTRSPIGRSLVQSMTGRGTKVTAPSTTSTTAPNNPANRTNPQNQMRINQLHHEQEEHELHEKQRLEILRQQTQQKAAAKMAAAKIDPSMLKGFQSATNTKGMGPVAPVTPVKKTVAPAPETPAPKPAGTSVRTAYGIDPKDPNAPLQPTTPTRGGGRGF